MSRKTILGLSALGGLTAALPHFGGGYNNGDHHSQVNSPHYRNNNGYNNGDHHTAAAYDAPGHHVPGYGTPGYGAPGNGNPGYGNNHGEHHTTPSYGTPRYGYNPPTPTNIPTTNIVYMPPAPCTYGPRGYECPGSTGNPTGTDILPEPTGAENSPSVTGGEILPTESGCVYISTQVVTSTYVLTISFTEPGPGPTGSRGEDEPTGTTYLPEHTSTCDTGDECPTNGCDHGDTDCNSHPSLTSDLPRSTGYSTVTETPYPTSTPEPCDGEPCPCDGGDSSQCSEGPSATPNPTASEGTESPTSTPTPTSCSGDECGCEGGDCAPSSTAEPTYPASTSAAGYGYGGGY
ncbi:hypothetical protein BCR34DRAFT_269661 [Clohesyomyces aquaticus]|uniref:Uncharacterized protein n=1 Tax=Clohesyomyces aquaticus TaxID=1231657 RepID=A0A1Y1Y214_9PLEO|nr:hypothetical protein BCR34DRAFT_269661 [Clohesyomyces aquaticus]